MRCLCSSWALLKKCFNFLCLCLFQNSDLASGALRRGGLNSLAHLDVEAAGAYVPPRFMARVHAHIVKNYFASEIDATVPLIMAIWGEKGQGKSFNLALCCRALGLHPIFLFSGELEDVRAGAPGRRVRQRYREAIAAAASGQASALILPDFDAGAGRFRNSQMTVNTQVRQKGGGGEREQAPGPNAT